MELHPQILKKNGRKEFVVLPYEEFERIEKELQNYHDLCDLREARRSEGTEETMSLSDVRNELGI